ncbi:MAG: YraN family protein [Puniceicoccales bacterium]|jgi:putative endonuclease|nr:YraN family protein [Puniceicoccales bacterium]
MEFFVKFFRKTALTPRQKTGNDGEKLAENFLKKRKKYKILEKNWRHKSGEIDIIAQDGAVTVFVEVRARQKNALVSGYFSVTKKKKSALKPVLEAYIGQNYLQFFRFDVIEIACDGSTRTLFHYENIPIFSG